MFASLVLALTLLMIGVHVGEWVRLGQLARASRSGTLKSSRVTRVLGLMNFLRFEAFYYVVLVVFCLTNEGAVPGVAVFLLGAIHVGGWAALEARKSLPQLEAVAAAAHNPQAGVRGTRVRRLLAGIAAFDAVEVLILAYFAYRLSPA
ncbi:MAG: hypothetical protein ACE5MH_03245 [Terriglobia bacterium]